MNNEKIIEINESVLSIINEARDDRKLKQKKGVNLLPRELRFLYKTSQFNINELIALCKDDYREIITVLITKSSSESVGGYKYINKFRHRPFVFINMLAFHPASKVKVNGVLKYAVSKLLKRNKVAFDLARKIYNKFRG